LLVEGEAAGAEVDLVIGGIESDQTDHEATDELNPGLVVETEETDVSMCPVWRNCSTLAG